ncbi:DUF1003 domain-containing protein [Chitinophaga sancti]|uniref:DUF1003 domain-containing protein n=1 Tax=Chitinophaga sancti TaxID=1004 RepID=A0A1K1SA68_9BACT|nr:DUF1003 domain-containing protein [Chitinophaga sancti]WQD60930.1 DUF1003 domain-containing protein [Chitinophaga sancti]WQG86942.1 DUF1003 domain-containing protein [Chitinophaga sancti]SFW80917.1 Uncharacterized membrane protein [Chitinophaga sancti]
MQNFISDLSGNEFPANEKINCRNVRKSVMDMIRKDHPDLSSKSKISLSELNKYRQHYFEHLFAKEIGELTEMEKTVIEKLRDNETLTDKLDDGDGTNLTLGQRVADKIADFGGSWTFIISFFVFILLWMAANFFWLVNKGFDPYPFILLNLILSCLAALQAPVIMMSQNRQEEKDRIRAKNDYMINLKSELEVRILHEKIDHLIIHQQQDMMEMQQTQIEMLSEMSQSIKKLNGEGNINHREGNGNGKKTE